MTEHERLVELIDSADIQINGNITPYRDYGISDLADHILDDGWVKLPCKVGDTVYAYNYLEYPHKLREGTVKSIKIQKNHFTGRVEFIIDYFYANGIFHCSDQGRFGDNVFHTKTEAEEALKGGEVNNE